MKFTTAILPLLLAASTSAVALWGSSASSVKVADGGQVPGDNPLHYCAKPDGYTISIKKVDISPNPPKAGQNLTVTATGTVHKEIEDGAKVQLQVKYGLITLIKTEVDLCEEVGQVDLECPIEKGERTLSKEVALPAAVPPGRYTVLADVKSKSGETITCLSATIVFSRNGAAQIEMIDL